MKIHCTLPALLVLLLFCCTEKYNTNLFPGTWKIKKIAIFHNDFLCRTIDTGCQYWIFYKNDSIQIYDGRHLQNSLQIKIDKQIITSIDRANRCDEFFIDLASTVRLELSSRQKQKEEVYKIVYYLERLSDGEEGEMISYHIWKLHCDTMRNIDMQWPPVGQFFTFRALLCIKTGNYLK